MPFRGDPPHGDDPRPSSDDSRPGGHDPRPPGDDRGDGDAAWAVPAETPPRLAVGIRRLRPDVPMPAYHSPGAAAMDIVADEDMVVLPGEVRLVGTGLVVHVPAGYFLAIVARSSLPIKKGLIVANGVGVVDSDYCGPDDEVRVEVMNTTAMTVSVARGERIAQAMVLPVPRVEWIEMEEVAGPSRGGFGATGGLE